MASRKSELKRKEEKLEKELMAGLKQQGFLATKTSDRFKAGRADLRIGHKDWAQMDVELKYNDWPMSELEKADGSEIDTGMTKLQWLKIGELNSHGMPAVCLIYFEALDEFRLTTLLRYPLSLAGGCVVRKLPPPRVIEGGELFVKAMELLHEQRYRFPGSGRWGAHNWRADTKHRLGPR